MSAAAVKEQNWKQKSPRNDCLVSMNGPGLQAAVIEPVSLVSSLGTT